MSKVVLVESSLKRYLETLKSDGFTLGLLLGQNSVIKDFVVHLVRTQVPRDSSDITNFKKVNDVKEEHVIEHIRNVIQILPGGITVLGLFFVGEANLLNATTLSIVKNILNAIIKFQEDYESCFLDTNSKYILHYVDSANIFCKRFLPLRTGNQFDVVECIFSTNSWHQIRCYYDFQHLLPVYVETVSNALLHDKFMDILKCVSQSIKESVLLFNGEVRNESESIKNLKRPNERSAPNIVDNDTEIVVDVYAPCMKRISNVSNKISVFETELKCFGTLCCIVYLHDDANVNEAVQAVKEDIIRSLHSRLTLHCNSLLEDLGSSCGNDEAKIIHEPPRRISVMLPYSKVCFTDYLFPGEDSTSTLPTREQLDIRDMENEMLYKLLEVEADASEFYSQNSVTNNIENLVVRKSNLPFTMSLGLFLTLLVLILAIFFQKKIIL